MKQVILLALVLLCSCKKEEDNRWWPYVGVTTAQINGVAWQADNFAILIDELPNTFHLRMDEYNERGFARKVCGMARIPLAHGKYTIAHSDVNGIADSLVAFRLATAHGDVSGDSFLVAEFENFENYVEVTEIRGKRITGRFQVAMVRNTQWKKSDFSVPDTLFIENGVFETKSIKLPE